MLLSSLVTISLNQDRLVNNETTISRARRLTSSHLNNNNSNNNKDMSHNSGLFEGFGSHYTYVNVGSPAHQATMIIDTGSHHTALPSIDCDQHKCGKHMHHPFYNPSLSNSAIIPTCFAYSKCYFKQAYTEGSSWQAYQVTDLFSIGNAASEQQHRTQQQNQQHRKLRPHQPHIYKQSDQQDKTSKENNNNNNSKQPASLQPFQIPFQFGCIVSETGLFRTQMIDGILGASFSTDTFPFQLHQQQAASTKAFVLCLRDGGGYMSLGVENNNNEKRLSYLSLVKSSGWYTVELVDMFMFLPNSTTATATATDRMTSLNVASSIYNTGKGTIIDSGTTDTYLTSSIKNKFDKLFFSFTNIPFHNKKRKLTSKEFQALPVVVFRFRGMREKEFVDVSMPPSSYAEQISPHNNNNNNKENNNHEYIFRIYLTESTGCVLGSNFMKNNYILFDPDNKRVGLKPSACE